MTLPRSEYGLEGKEGVYYCFSSYVRRAYLGIKALTHRDFCRRKSWLVERLQYLADILAIEVCAYAVMENHYNGILQVNWAGNGFKAWLRREPPLNHHCCNYLSSIGA